MSPLPEEEKRALLGVARKAIYLRVSQAKFLSLSGDEAGASAPRGAFVTLHRRGRLRGCMGRLETMEPLASVVAQCAVSAATDDPRFSPVTVPEIAELEIEISVLSDLQATHAHHVEAGKHGLVISRGGRRGVLLPQVASEHGWGRERFLEETCRKAGLHPECWKQPETRIEIFTAEIFSEVDFRAPARDTLLAGGDRSDYSSSQ